MLEGAVVPRKAGALAAALLAMVFMAGCQRQAQPDGPAAPERAEGPDVAAMERREAAALLAQLGGPASAEQRALYEGFFEASGALEGVGAGEGAWELQLTDGYAALLQPGLGQDGGVTGPRNFRANGMQVTAGPLTITLRAGACTLPNNVRTDYRVHVLFEGVAYEGCARPTVAGARNAASWATILPELLPAIDACLARSPSPPARVMIASVIEEGVVSVRLREADGGRDECIASATGETITSYGPISDLDRRAGEGDPEFVRAPGPPPAGTSCRSVTPVPAAQEAAPPLGWLIRRTC